jgi:hypothetical protein
MSIKASISTMAIQRPVSKAYAAAAEMVSSGEIEATKEKFMAAIGSVLADSSEDCPQCEEQGEDED